MSLLLTIEHEVFIGEKIVTVVIRAEVNENFVTYEWDFRDKTLFNKAMFLSYTLKDIEKQCHAHLKKHGYIK